MRPDHTSMPHDQVHKLPVEILDQIFKLLHRGDLYRILQVNCCFYSLGIRILYRSVVDLQPDQTVELLQSLCENEHNPPLVREFVFEFGACCILGNALPILLHRALTRLTALVLLSVTFQQRSNNQSLAWIFDGCSFSLQQFETSIRCDASLARFLDRQPNITRLALGGFQPGLPFTLLPSSLPQLSHIRAVPSGPPMLAEVIRGRPVQSVSLTLSMHDGTLALESLRLSSRTISRISGVVFHDEMEPSFLFSEISQRFPELRELHIFSTSKFTSVCMCVCYLGRGKGGAAAARDLMYLGCTGVTCEVMRGAS